jgi:hypothetical protein
VLAVSSRARRRVPVGRIGLFVGVGTIANLLPSLGNPFSSHSVDRSQPAVLNALEDLSEYRAATGQFQVIVDVEQDTKYVPSFLKGERTLFVASGNVDATVDFSTLDDSAIAVSEDGKHVTVTLPPARLQEARVDTEASHVVDRDRGVLDRVGSVFSDSPTGERELYLLAEDKLEAAAVADGRLTKRAQANTREMLTGMLEGLGYDDVTVRFQKPASANNT